MNKTLIGKNSHLFLINDNCRELDVHCYNLNLVKDKEFKKYNFENYLLIVFPNKSLIFKNYLPDNFQVKYRPALEEYKNVLKEKLIDTYEILKNEEDVYYKTDTHINLKGSYIVFKNFIKKLNEFYNLNIYHKEINITNIKCNLLDLPYGIGDLLWPQNLGNQNVDEKIDSFYYSEEISHIYMKYIIKSDKSLRILNRNLVDITDVLENKIVEWKIISTYILFNNNKFCLNKYKVIIFYDSFLLSTLSLYLELFEEVYMIKSVYENEIINLIKPDFVFEFRVERFLQ